MTTTNNATDMNATLITLKATAAAQVAKHPQYDGHFANYRLARVKRDVKTKMGQAFIKGEFVIAIEREATVHNGIVVLPAGVTAWSRRNACDTALNARYLEWL